jgi:hypothetical protein
MNIKKYSHKDHEYSMSFDKKNDQYMVDANQMARPFNKFVADFLRLKQTQSFIKWSVKPIHRFYVDGM